MSAIASRFVFTNADEPKTYPEVNSQKPREVPIDAYPIFPVKAVIPIYPKLYAPAAAFFRFAVHTSAARLALCY